MDYVKTLILIILLKESIIFSDYSCSFFWAECKDMYIRCISLRIVVPIPIPHLSMRCNHEETSKEVKP
jgi:hypothetical protein